MSLGLGVRSCLGGRSPCLSFLYFGARFHLSTLYSLSDQQAYPPSAKTIVTLTLVEGVVWTGELLSVTIEILCKMAKTFRTSCATRSRMISVPLIVFGNLEFWICYENAPPACHCETIPTAVGRPLPRAIEGGAIMGVAYSRLPSHLSPSAIFILHCARCKQAWSIVSDLGFRVSDFRFMRVRDSGF